MTIKNQLKKGGEISLCVDFWLFFGLIFDRNFFVTFLYQLVVTLSEKIGFKILYFSCWTKKIKISQKMMMTFLATNSEYLNYLFHLFINSQLKKHKKKQWSYHGCYQIVFLSKNYICWNEKVICDFPNFVSHLRILW